MNIKKIIFLAVIIFGGVFIIWGAVSFKKKSSEPLSQDFSREVSFEGSEHISNGIRVEYKSNPPASGTHWPTWLSDGVYNKEKPDEAVVHSLEHGRVWVSYRPSILEETKKELEKLLKGQSVVILTPRERNETDIALAAWQRLDTFNLNDDGSFDKNRILDFIERYRLKGPESLTAGQMGGSRYDNWEGY